MRAINRRTMTLLAVLLWAVAGAAGAEDGRADARTVASAQEFLRQVLPGNRYVSTMMSGILAKAGRDGLRRHFEPLPVNVDSDPVPDCRSYPVDRVDDTW